MGKDLKGKEKPMHCQNVLNQMKDDYKSSTIYQTRITLYCMFSDAVENDVILKNPVTKAAKYNIENLKRLEHCQLMNKRSFLK